MTLNYNDLSVAVIGSGYWGKNLVRNYHDLGVLKLICDKNEILHKSFKEKYPGVEELRLAVMGCVVNGPGESKVANIGISLPGTGEAPSCPVYVDGRLFKTLKGTPDQLATEFKTIIDEYVARKYGSW